MREIRPPVDWDRTTCSLREAWKAVGIADYYVLRVHPFAIHAAQRDAYDVWGPGWWQLVLVLPSKSGDEDEWWLEAGDASYHSTGA